MYIYIHVFIYIYVYIYIYIFIFLGIHIYIYIYIYIVRPSVSSYQSSPSSLCVCASRRPFVVVVVLPSVHPIVRGGASVSGSHQKMDFESQSTPLRVK